MENIVPCKYWRPNGKHDGGSCSISAYANPSRGTCMRVCSKYEGPQRTPELIEKIVNITRSCCTERNKKSRGLGDTIAKLTSAVGIKPCGGCKKRQEWLNKAIPYRDTEQER